MHSFSLLLLILNTVLVLAAFVFLRIAMNRLFTFGRRKDESTSNRALSND